MSTNKCLPITHLAGYSNRYQMYWRDVRSSFNGVRITIRGRKRDEIGNGVCEKWEHRARRVNDPVIEYLYIKPLTHIFLHGTMMLTEWLVSIIVPWRNTPYE